MGIARKGGGVQGLARMVWSTFSPRLPGGEEACQDGTNTFQKEAPPRNATYAFILTLSIRGGVVKPLCKIFLQIRKGLLA